MSTFRHWAATFAKILLTVTPLVVPAVIAAQTAGGQIAYNYFGEPLGTDVCFA